MHLDHYPAVLRPALTHLFALIFPGIPSNAELNKILASAYAAGPTGGKHGSNQPADYVVPQTSPGVHEQPSIPVSQRLLSAQQDKTFSTLSSKPGNQVTDSAAQGDFINKLILKAVQKEMAKLKIDGILKDALMHTKAPQQNDSNDASSQEKQNMQEHEIGNVEEKRAVSEQINYQFCLLNISTTYSCYCIVRGNGKHCRIYGI